MTQQLSMVLIVTDPINDLFNYFLGCANQVKHRGFIKKIIHWFHRKEIRPDDLVPHNRAHCGFDLVSDLLYILMTYLLLYLMSAGHYRI